MRVKGGTIDIRANPEGAWEEMENGKCTQCNSVASRQRVDCSIQTFWHVLVRVRFHFSPSLQRKCVKSAIKAVNRVNCKCEMRFTLLRFGLCSV